MLEDRELFRFYVPVKVRFAETDANGHMSHVSIVLYMEQARTEYAMELGLVDLSRIGETGQTFVLASQTIDYAGQAYFNDRLDVYARISRIGRSSLDMAYLTVRRGTGEVVATGRSTQVYFDARAQKSIPLPSDLAARAEAFEQAFADRMSGSSA